MTTLFQKYARPTTCIAIAVALASAHALASGAWTPTSGSMSAGHNYPSMVELRDGRVAVLGGIGSDEGWTAMELYDPATNTWSRGGSMVWGRFEPTLLPLSDGRLFISGGQNEGGTGFPESEIYDPATNAWTRLAPTAELGSFGSASVSLPQDRVLVTGGFYDLTYRGIADCAILDPMAGAGTRVAPMRSKRGFHSLVHLDDTHVLAVGGYHEDFMLGATTTAEIYDVTANTWTAAAPTSVGRASAFAARLPDGRVLIAGGRTDLSGTPLSSVEIYDPASNTWTSAPPLTTPRSRPTGGVMFDGRVIVMSSDPVSGEISGEEWIPGASAWTPIAAPASRAAGANAFAFNGGQYLLLAGGYNASGFVTTGEVYKLNHHPVAVATVTTPAARVLPGNKAAIDVSAAGSSDADGDRLTYTWTSGGTVLAQTNDPMARATLGLGIGTHTITLTATDVFGDASTATVSATVADGTSDAETRIRALERERDEAVLSAKFYKDAVVLATTTMETAWKFKFGDPSFKLPGTSPVLKLGAFVAATLIAPTSAQHDIYRALGGRK